MSKRIVAALSAALLFTSCVKEITERRAPRARDQAAARRSTSSTAGDLVKLKCDDITAELSKARDDSAPEEKRLTIYTDLYERVKDRTTRFDEALSRNPDLAYQEGSQEIIAARDGCIQSAADVRLDFEGLVREIINLPVVDEIRDGKPVKAARLSFDTACAPRSRSSASTTRNRCSPASPTPRRRSR